MNNLCTGYFARVVFEQDIIKEIAQSRSLSSSMGGGGAGAGDDKKTKIGHKGQLRTLSGLPGFYW